jgi:hypothetical protein
VQQPLNLYGKAASSACFTAGLPSIREEPEEVETLKLDQIEVMSYVGGLVKSFERKIA